MSASTTFASEEARFKSFRHWPHSTSKTATPRKLAQAGFYHNPNPENPDRCTCFMCGTSLVAWDVTDIPLEEHRRHARHCEYLRILARNNHSSLLSGTEQTDEPQDNAFSSVTRSIIEHMEKSWRACAGAGDRSSSSSSCSSSSSRDRKS
eukprot:RCo011819